MSRRAAGFTLIELLVAIAIAGILVTIATASYMDHIRRSARADAKAVLMETAAWMERFYTTNGRYDQDTAGNAVALPFPRSPKDAAAGSQRYDITLSAVASQSFTLQAAPVNAQAGEACGNLTLTNTGAMGVTGAGATVAECWQR